MLSQCHRTLSETRSVVGRKEILVSLTPVKLFFTTKTANHPSITLKTKFSIEYFGNFRLNGNIIEGDYVKNKQCNHKSLKTKKKKTEKYLFSGIITVSYLTCRASNRQTLSFSFENQSKSPGLISKFRGGGVGEMHLLLFIFRRYHRRIVGDLPFRTEVIKRFYRCVEIRLLHCCHTIDVVIAVDYFSQKTILLFCSDEKIKK